MFSRIAPPNLDLNDLWNGDLYGRKAIADQFCKLLQTTTQSTTIGISAPYGFGKTFFLTRLKEKIKSEGGWVVYVNAWEYDYLENPLLAVLDSLKAAFSEIGDKEKSKSALADLAKSAGPVLAKVAVKRGLGVIFGEGGAQDVIDAAGDATKESIEKTLGKILRDDPAQEVIQNLRRKIGELVQSNVKEDSKYKSLVILVDELDRARPDYCVSFMESVKHLLGAADIALVVGCDRAVFISSAKHQFGEELPIDGYIRRLFDYWIELPKPSPNEYVQRCVTSLNLIEDKIVALNKEPGNGLYSYMEFLDLGACRSNLSLRFIEQSVCVLNLYLRTTPAQSKFIGLAGFLQALKFADRQLFDEYVYGVNLQARVSAIARVTWPAETDSSREWLTHILIAGTHTFAEGRNIDSEVLLAWAQCGDEHKQFLPRTLTNGPFRYSNQQSLARRIDERLSQIVDIVRT